MFRHLTVMLAATLGLACAQVMAHEGHDHEEEALSEKQVGRLAAKTLPSLVQSKKVGAAWNAAQREGIRSRSAAGKEIWVVTYKNPDGKVDNGKPLHLIFDDLGNFVEANHTGKLATE
jgi:hypothetical protein